ncbi:polyprenyl synthetase family protein [Streptomyces sp. RFCAC02]|uniref:polyprenyl synthetase family protein n=1 Tax=Streptomyces sp. RFCAC02 TaxID=2499143 RepID=UPI00101EB50C|nr:polyprenyl synthetase family protein [Streptomyces sp. RFCAC02]
MTDPHGTAAFKSRVDGVLADFLARETDAFLAVDPDLAPVAEQVRAAAAHGKRLRAAFCYWGWRAAGQPDSAPLVRAAAAMELVHAAAIVHDDLIDDSPLRHGRPTAHVALRAALRRRPRAATAARSLAVLVGDLLMSLAGQLFVTSGLPGAYLARARPLWAALARDLVAGECLEILRTGAAPDTAESLRVIRYKTAKYTVEQPLLIGGALAGAGTRLRDGYSAYGLPLGEAFQLRDDLIGLFGDPAVTGKANPDDLRARRPTALLAETWRAADAADRALLRGLLGRRLDDAGVETVRGIMRRLRAPESVERMITERVGDAVRALDGMALSPPAAEALTSLAHAAAVRQQ